MSDSKKNEPKLKSHIISLRLDEEQLRYLEAANRVLDENKTPGTTRISKTDTVKALMYYGMEIFKQKYGDPLNTPKEKKTKK